METESAETCKTPAMAEDYDRAYVQHMLDVIAQSGEMVGPISTDPNNLAKAVGRIARNGIIDAAFENN